jgi:hypothetical protein
VCSLGREIPDGSGDRLSFRLIHTFPYRYEVLRFNLHTGQVQTIFRGETGLFQSLSPNGRYMAFTNTNHHLAILDLQTEIMTDTGEVADFGDLEEENIWDNQSRHLLFWQDEMLRLWNMETQETTDILLRDNLRLRYYDTEWLEDGGLWLRITNHYLPEDEWLMQSAEWIIQVP